MPSDCPGISIVDTDLEVDFATPKGYVEPTRPTRDKPGDTMREKLNIDLNGSTPGTSRPGSAMADSFGIASGSAPGVSKAGKEWESFKGKGETLAGRKTKGKGISVRGIEDDMPGSKIIRTGFVFLTVEFRDFRN